MKMLKVLMIITLMGAVAVGGNALSLELQHAKKACDNNMAAACFELGEVYREGAAGVDVNFTEAENYYRKACDGGFDKGCYWLEKLEDHRYEGK